MEAATLAYWCGAALVGAAVLQMLAWIAGGLRRAAAERRRFAAEMQLLQAQIAAAAAVAARAPAAAQAWSGWRKFRVREKVRETADAVSFYLVPHDGRPLPPYAAGQYVAVSLRPGGASAPVVRCYSLSSRPHDDHYRITVKRVEENADGRRRVGLASGWLCDEVNVDDLIDLKAPAGDFVLEPSNTRPIVLLAAGIGVTPLAAMAEAALETGFEGEIRLLLGMRDGAHHIFREQFNALAEAHPNLHRFTAYSRPRAVDVAGRDYDLAGRLTIDVVRRVLPSSNYRFFVCGPGAFMQELVAGIRDWGVPDDDIRFEAFGPASLKTASKPAARGAKGSRVTFSRTGKQVEWTGVHASLLELAEEVGAEVEAGCRSGACGTCLTSVRSGAVAADAGGADGSCLICVSTPTEDVVLDA